MWTTTNQMELENMSSELSHDPQSQLENHQVCHHAQMDNVTSMIDMSKNPN